MRDHHSLFGMHVPGDSWLHRWPAWAKFLLVLGGSLPAVVVQNLWLSLAMMVLFVVVLLSTRLPLRLTMRLPWMLLLIVAALLAYHSFQTSWQVGVMLSANMIGAVLAARALILTTPGPELVDTLTAAAGPVRHVGGNPERFGLAVGIMLRSIPHLMGSFGDVRDALRARGMERNLAAQVTPVVVHAVAYAQATGEALAARGLGDDD